MPSLVQSLSGSDLSLLRIIAEIWGVEFKADESPRGVEELAALILDRKLTGEMVQSLPERARDALNDLLLNEGRLPWGAFSRRHGEVREVGAGKRDRDRPYETANASAAEMLWYRALIARAFFDTPTGPQEFAFVPDDWLEILPPVHRSELRSLGRPASPGERGEVLNANDSILEDACTLLGGLRNGLSPEEIDAYLVTGKDSVARLTVEALEMLVRETGLLDREGNPRPENVRGFLENSRSSALVKLVGAWQRSDQFNELRLIPGISLEGEWRNDALAARRTLIEFVSTIPGGQSLPGAAGRPWWSLSAFIAAIHQHHPDFLRSGGEYDSWYLRNAQNGEWLGGFENWERVEGAFIRFIICGPLHWLGILDLSLPTGSNGGDPKSPAAFRFSEWSSDLLDQVVGEKIPDSSGKLVVLSDGRIQSKRGVPLAARYQVTRFCDWEGLHGEAYNYRISPRGLRRASKQGLKTEHLVSLLNRHAQKVPPSLVEALKRWDSEGSQARLERLDVLRLKDPKLMLLIRESKAKRFLGEVLGPTAVIVKEGAWEKLMLTLTELGYLVDLGEPSSNMYEATAGQRLVKRSPE